MQPIKRKYGVKEILDTLPEFRIWIEQTSLFDTIKRFTNPEMIDGKPVISMFSNINVQLDIEDLNINLLRHAHVQTAYDLPIELVQQFYQNSPFFTLADGVNVEDIYKPVKLLDNGSIK